MKDDNLISVSEFIRLLPKRHKRSTVYSWIYDNVIPKYLYCQKSEYKHIFFHKDKALEWIDAGMPVKHKIVDANMIGMKEFISITGLPSKSVYNYINNGRIPKTLFTKNRNNRIKFYKDMVIDWVKEGRPSEREINARKVINELNKLNINHESI